MQKCDSAQTVALLPDKLTNFKEDFSMLLRSWFRITLVTISAMVLPCILSAQNSGVAGNGTFQLMWRGTDSHISLWSLDSSNNINLVTSREYGPYYGWLPIALTTANSGISYILWRNTN